MTLPETCSYLDWPNLERNLLALDPYDMSFLGLLMAKREHTIRSMMLGRAACACGWYYIVPRDLQDKSRMRKTDALLDAWLDHAADMRKLGH